MKTNDIKKGAHVITRLGQIGIMIDNKRGNIRMVQIGGDIGSVYAHDIMEVLVFGEWVDVEHTDSQIGFRKITGPYVSG